MHTLHIFTDSVSVSLWVKTHYLVVCLVCRKAVKATLVLLPLLGITYMLFFVNPGEDEISQIVFIYFNSFLESFQVRKRLAVVQVGEDDVTKIL